ncbi:MAG: phosphodiester glycosidase family protein [Flavobacteriales bacterium]|nr:phosphodiester glycosidase family protein [Flavobacteriales bacterium]
MNKIGLIVTFLLGACLFSFISLKKPGSETDDSRVLSYVVNPKQQDLKFYRKDKEGKNYANFQRLKELVETKNRELVFAMNGGMYRKDGSPQGLYIEDGITCTKINARTEAYGNFYMQPNGIFYLTADGKPVICVTSNFISQTNISYATQSGPMLVIEGELHPRFTTVRKINTLEMV